MCGCPTVSGGCGSCPCGSGLMWSGSGCITCASNQYGVTGYSEWTSYGCFYQQYQCCAGPCFWGACFGFCGCWDPCFGLFGGCNICVGSYCSSNIYYDCIRYYSGYSLPSLVATPSTCSNLTSFSIFNLKVLIFFLLADLSPTYVDYHLTVQDGYAATIVCPIGQTILIKDSWYGRWDSSIYPCPGCSQNSDPCYWPNYQWIAYWCNNQNSCSGPWGYIRKNNYNQFFLFFIYQVYWFRSLLRNCKIYCCFIFM